MQLSRIQEILPYVEKPSRYLGTEINRIKKDPESVHLKIALAFPDLYEIGTSHFGIQILYDILNRCETISAEQVFAPDRDMEQMMRRHGLPLCTVESQRPLSTFHIIGFSLLYELNYTNVLNMLRLSGLPLRACDRNSGHPLVIAGGPCVANPEPLAPFFDAMLFGDGEQAVLELAAAWLSWKQDGGQAKQDKQALLRLWSQIDGVYVPEFFDFHIDGHAVGRLRPRLAGYSRVQRCIIGDLDQAAFPLNPVVPFGRPVHDRLRLEISRGCSRGCRFCQAGMIYRPVRERSPQTLIELSQKCLDGTGYEDLSLLSLSTGDYSCLSALLENLMHRGQQNRIAVSLPSIRAGTLTPDLMKMIKKVRKTGFTIAPEAGSQRLRDVINKNITFEDVARTVRDAFDMGWQVIKLYFMIGLPTETEADLQAIVQMVRELKKIKGPENRRGKINVSVTTFIPKAHTPFQWCAQIDLETSRSKIQWLKDQLKIPGVHFKWQSPEMSMLEGALARGDRRLAPVIESAFELGCTFDGWTDRFHFDLWQQAFDRAAVDMGLFTTRQRSLKEPLPWEHMDAGLNRSFLEDQWFAAQSGTPLADCRSGDCHQCGVCDFEHIQPRFYDQCPALTEKRPISSRNVQQRFAQLELTYCKLDLARFFGHLEQAHIFSRALRRACIEVAYSKGFHPMPRIAFDDPLPLGMESESEQLRIVVRSDVCCDELVAALNPQLPPGLSVIGCKPVDPQQKKLGKPDLYRYRVALGDQKLDNRRLEEFLDSRAWMRTRQKAKRQTQPVDIRRDVHVLRLESDRQLYMELAHTGSHLIRPADVLQAVFGLKPEQIAPLRVRKLRPES
jgi:radical SAM family uncharacterized protein/radical SAM-linked protein